MTGEVILSVFQQIMGLIEDCLGPDRCSRALAGKSFVVPDFIFVPHLSVDGFGLGEASRVDFQEARLVLAVRNIRVLPS